jgi:hypothetical protein
VTTRRRHSGAARRRAAIASPAALDGIAHALGGLLARAAGPAAGLN